MDDDDTLILALYKWAVGDCFRCTGTGVDTTSIADVPTPIGDRYEVRACQVCVLDLERERRASAEAAGEVYVPGGLTS
jgi:hypothetical protein